MTPLDPKPAQTMAAAVLAIEKEIAFPPACITFAQAVLESGRFHSSLFTQANNPYGIKRENVAWGEFDVATREVVTTATLAKWRAQGIEIISASPRPDGLVDAIIKAKFQRFPNLVEATRQHALLFRLPWYLRCQAAYSVYGWRGVARTLGPVIDSQTGKPYPPGSAQFVPSYSTDPDYGRVLTDVIMEYRLDDAAVLQSYAEKGTAA